MQAHCETLRRQVHVVNLDPAAEVFDYNALADIRDLIHVIRPISRLLIFLLYKGGRCDAG